ncbi:DUF2690 domain-containing protein [Hamadaea sp. NPDC050747]|uniref:DUF2690 domain-containing protein n=1 Tax=Hamadaea sp. NPDC050747 TaxID=3155789 RepID=UPI0033EBA740
MTRIKHFAAALALAVLAIAGTQAALITPAAAAGSCWGSDCNHYDPNTLGCGSDAYTLEKITENLVTIELRYSPSCYAAWTRFEVHSDFAFPTTVFLRGSSTTEYRNLPIYEGAKGWTAMVSFQQAVKSCMQWYNGGYYEICTPTH